MSIGVSIIAETEKLEELGEFSGAETATLNVDTGQQQAGEQGLGLDTTDASCTCLTLLFRVLLVLASAMTAAIFQKLL